MLKLLLEEKYPRNRREFASALGITESALSQYVRGDAAPKLRVLATMAPLLGVPLDYLVNMPAKSARCLYGEESRASAVGSVEDQAHEVFRKAEKRAEDLSHLTREIGERLIAEVAVQARETLADAVGNGLLSIEDVKQLECNSTYAQIVTSWPLCDKNDDGSDDQGSDGAARFIATMARNLARGQQYSYVIAESKALADEAAEIADRLTEALADDSPAARKLLEFVDAPAAEVVPGFVIYTLVESELLEAAPALYSRLREYLCVSAQGEQLVGLIEPHGITPRTFQLAVPTMTRQLVQRHEMLIRRYGRAD